MNKEQVKRKSGRPNRTELPERVDYQTSLQADLISEMNRLGLTSKDLSEKESVNVSKAQIDQYKCGKRRIPPNRVHEFIEAGLEMDLEGAYALGGYGYGTKKPNQE